MSRKMKLEFLAGGTMYSAEVNYWQGYPATRWEPEDPAEIEILTLHDADTGEDLFHLLENPLFDFIQEAAEATAWELIAEERGLEADALYQAWKDDKLIGEQL